MFRFYYNIEPENLTDEKFIQLVNELHYMLDFEGKRATTHGKLQMPII